MRTVITQIRRREAARRALAHANAGLESKLQEQAARLQEIEQHGARLVEWSDDLILRCAPDRSVLHANPAALRVLRASDPASPLGRLIESLFGAAEQAWLPQWLEGLWSTPQTREMREANLLGADGAAVPVQLGAVSYRGSTGMLVQLVMHDLTQRRAQEAALREQLRFIDQLVDAIPAPVSVRDERGAYLRVNRAYEMLYQCDRNNIQGRSLADVLPVPLATLLAQKDAAAMQRIQPLVYEFQFQPPGGAVNELLARARALRRSDGRVSGVITVDTDVGMVRLKETQLLNANLELEAMSHQLLHAQEGERRRIARDLHDQLGQILTALKVSLQMLAWQPGLGHDAVRLPLELAEEALGHTRSLTASLHPQVLEHLGLEAAVRSLLDRFVRPSVARFHLEADVAPARSLGTCELAAFRVVQEALTNVVRHASAGEVKVSLETQGDRLHLTIVDDGRGFDAGADGFDMSQAESPGMAGMHERVVAIGGNIRISSAIGEGTKVHADVPWKPLHAAHA